MIDLDLKRNIEKYLEPIVEDYDTRERQQEFIFSQEISMPPSWGSDREISIELLFQLFKTRLEREASDPSPNSNEGEK